MRLVCRGSADDTRFDDSSRGFTKHRREWGIRIHRRREQGRAPFRPSVIQIASGQFKTKCEQKQEPVESIQRTPLAFWWITFKSIAREQIKIQRIESKPVSVRQISIWQCSHEPVQVGYGSFGLQIQFAFWDESSVIPRSLSVAVGQQFSYSK